MRGECKGGGGLTWLYLRPVGSRVENKRAGILQPFHR
jgi:hypothetical protein